MPAPHAQSPCGQLRDGVQTRHPSFCRSAGKRVMSLGRRSARRQSVFALYQKDLLNISADSALERYRGESTDPYVLELVHGVSARQDEIDELLREHISGWSVQRLGTLERAILRVATYEMMWKQDVPAAVAIDEAVVLAKKFCSDEAGALVNGVLGSLAKEVAREREATTD